MGILPQRSFAQEFWSLGYYSPDNGAPLSSFNGVWGGLTHITVTDVYPQADGSLTYGDSSPSTQFAAAVSAGHANGVKVLLGVSDIGAGNMKSAVQNNLSTLVANIMAVV